MKTKLIEMWKDMSKPKVIDWVLVIAIIVFCFISFNHTDLTWTATHGKDLVELTLKGDFFEFYDYAEETAVYLIPIYILFAIWSIPVVFCMKILNLPLWGATEFSAMGFRLIMWYKLLPSLFYLATAWVIYKIGLQLGMSKNKSKWMTLIWISFPIAVFSQFVVGQYDSICMFFTMWALLFYLQKKYYKFSIVMSIAITFKLFPIFICIPLILLSEKRIIHIAKYTAISMAGYVISKALFMHSVAFQYASQFNNGMFNRLFQVGFTNSFGTMSIFLICVVFTCIWSYLKKVDENDINTYHKYAIYIGLFIYSSLFTCILWHPFWLLLLTPFLVIVAFQNDDLRLSMLIDIGLSILFILLTAGYPYWKVEAGMISLGIFPKIFGTRTLTMTLGNIFMFNDMINMNVFISLFVGILVGNLIWKYPRKSNLEQTSEIVKKELDIDRSYVWVRVLTICLYIIPTLYIFFK